MSREREIARKGAERDQEGEGAERERREIGGERLGERTTERD